MDTRDSPPPGAASSGGSAAAGPIAAAWRDNRRYLQVVAARILRDDADAEDVVAEAFVRFADQPADTLRDARGWLVVVVRRLALDRLRSAHARLTEPADPAEPLLDVLSTDDRSGFPAGATSPVDPADRVTLDDEIRRALSVVVDRLTPGERAAFVLHDVFGVSFEEIGDLVGRSAVACRKLASRARATIRAGRLASGGRTPPPTPELDRIADRFARACADGDVAALAALLHPDVAGWAFRGGVPLNEVHGREAICAGVVARFGPHSRWRVEPFPLDEEPAVLVMGDGEPAGLIRLRVDRGGLITQLRAAVLRRD